MADVAPLVAITGLVGLFSVLLRRRSGAARPSTAVLGAGGSAALALPAGVPSVVLFTSPGCAPCGPAKRVLAEVAGDLDVALVTADVAEHQDLATAARIFRAPTTLILDERGHAVARISGVPRREEVVAALDRAGTPTSPGRA